MELHSLILPGGVRIGSGVAGEPGIASVRLVETVNSGSRIRLGSVCAAMAEVTLVGPAVEVEPGTEMALYRGERLLGRFILDAPERTAKGEMKLTGYDRVCLLDKDITQWVLGRLPASLGALARDAAEHCGVELENETIPNGDVLVSDLDKASITARQLMRWCAEAAGCFCHATPEGKLRFDRYAESGVVLGPGDYFMGSLRFEDFVIEQVDKVLLSLPGGLRYPEAEPEDRVYNLSANPLLTKETATASVLENIRAGIPFGYSPCTVVCPMEVQAMPGQCVTIRDRAGVERSTLVMSRVTAGGRVTLRCTGYATGSPKAAYGDSVTETVDKALAAQTQQDIFNKLTKNGSLPGLFMRDGQLYINASYLAAGVIQSADGTVRMDLGDNNISIDGGYSLGDTYCKTRTELSANGIKSFAQNEDGDFVEVLSLTPGGPGQPTQLFNLYGDGLTVLPMAGVFTLGATVTPTVIRGSGIELWGLFEKLLELTADEVKILGRTVEWSYDAASGRYVLTGK